MNDPTPRPWKVKEHSTFVFSTHGNVCACGDPHASGYIGYTEPDIGSQYLGTAVANAALVVQAVNGHDVLLSALKAARGELYQLKHPTMTMDAFLADPVIQEIDAAIAKAEGSK